jgi:flavin reductase (DIM6/NTAB) family NADH-FMN oxidoreductase RutF
VSKTTLKPQTLLYPLPVVLLTAAAGGKTGIITLAWAGVVNSVPPMVSVSIRPSRFTHGLVEASGQFTLNIPIAAQLRMVDWCGTVSGRDTDKFSAAGLTPVPGERVSAPLIDECPVALECAVRHTLRLGSHDLYVAEVLAVRADAGLVTAGKLDLAGIAPLAYHPGTNAYHAGGGPVAPYGFSRGKLAAPEPPGHPKAGTGRTDGKG